MTPAEVHAHIAGLAIVWCPLIAVALAWWLL